LNLEGLEIPGRWHLTAHFFLFRDSHDSEVDELKVVEHSKPPLGFSG